LPKSHKGFKDKDGNPRHHIRIKWWDKGVKNYRDAFLGPEDVITHIPEEKINTDHLIEYDINQKPLFIGHYWLKGEVKPLAPNIACLDYSVAKPSCDAKLVAYTLKGEKTISQEHFISVQRQE
jgi:hypothetical protein